jgi:hypothetical protein
MCAYHTIVKLKPGFSNVCFLSSLIISVLQFTKLFKNIQFYIIIVFFRRISLLVSPIEILNDHTFVFCCVACG